MSSNVIYAPLKSLLSCMQYRFILGSDIKRLCCTWQEEIPSFLGNISIKIQCWFCHLIYDVEDQLLGTVMQYHFIWGSVVERLSCTFLIALKQSSSCCLLKLFWNVLAFVEQYHMFFCKFDWQMSGVIQKCNVKSNAWNIRELLLAAFSSIWALKAVNLTAFKFKAYGDDEAIHIAWWDIWNSSWWPLNFILFNPLRCLLLKWINFNPNVNK